MKTKLFIFALILTYCGMASAAVKLPEKAMGKPEIFYQEDLSSNWSSVVSKREWGKLSSNFWKVYIDRDGVVSRSAPSSSASIEKKDLEFMHQYLVAKVEGEFALLYEEKTEQTDLRISSSAKSVGWVSLNELLLWTTCPRTQNQVYQKAVILKDVDAIQDKRDLNEVSPQFSKRPDKMVPTGKRATELEFYFIYKIAGDGSALLLTESRIESANDVKRISHMGWMRRGNFTTWNDRTCYEPNFESGRNGIQAAIFQRKSDAKMYKTTGQIQGPLLWRDKLPTKRWPAKKTRFPVLEMEEYIANVGTIGSTGYTNSSEEASRKSSEIDNVTNRIDALSAKMAQVNVVFVIDGTRSMRNYYKPVALAVRDVMKRYSMQGAKFRFGAVVYRNYADDDVVEVKQLSSDVDEVTSWILSRDCHSLGTSHYEAMYLGLETALDRMNWNRDNANFLVHIGDAGNEKNDAKGKRPETVANKMSQLEVNYIAFQTYHPDIVAYHDFCTQIGEILVRELEGTFGRKIKLKDFKNSDRRMKEVSETVHGNQIITAAYHYAEIDQSESPDYLKELVEKKIDEFNEIAMRELNRFRAAVDEMSGDDLSAADKSDRVERFENIELFLQDRGFSARDIEVIKNKNVILKIKGYAPRVADDEDVFVPSIFMAKQELDDLIASLSLLTRSTSSNRRKDFQRTLVDLASTYLGEKGVDGIRFVDVTDAITGIRTETGRNPLPPDLKIGDVEDPNKLTDVMLDSYINIIKMDVELLKKRREDRSCYFDSPNGLRYYYILMSDMPLQEH